MADFVHIENGAIDLGPTSRPNRWKNISGLKNSDDAFLLTVGWYPVMQFDPAFDPATQIYADMDTTTQFVINATDVTWTRAVRALTARELAGIADQQAKAARKNVPNQGNGLPDVRAELTALKDTLRDQGFIV